MSADCQPAIQWRGCAQRLPVEAHPLPRGAGSKGPVFPQKVPVQTPLGVGRAWEYGTPVPATRLCPSLGAGLACECLKEGWRGRTAQTQHPDFSLRDPEGRVGPRPAGNRVWSEAATALRSLPRPRRCASALGVPGPSEHWTLCEPINPNIRPALRLWFPLRRTQSRCPCVP